MNLSQKLLIGILGISCGALFSVGGLSHCRAETNCNDIVKSILGTVEQQQEQSAQSLSQGFAEVEKSLVEANTKTLAIMVDLHKNSYQTLANQIFPISEGFDFDGAGSVIKTLLEQTPAIKWVQLQTKETPAEGDLLAFGAKQAEGESVLMFEHQMKNEFAFLKITMQVSMAEMSALNEVKATLDQINTDSQALSATLKKTSQDNLAQAKETAQADSAEMSARLPQQIILVVAASLAIMSGVLLLFVRRWVIVPINNTIAGLRENSDLVSRHAQAMSDSSVAVADSA